MVREQYRETQSRRVLPGARHAGQQRPELVKTGRGRRSTLRMGAQASRERLAAIVARPGQRAIGTGNVTGEVLRATVDLWRFWRENLLLPGADGGFSGGLDLLGRTNRPSASVQGGGGPRDLWLARAGYVGAQLKHGVKCALKAAARRQLASFKSCCEAEVKFCPMQTSRT